MKIFVSYTTIDSYINEGNLVWLNKKLSVYGETYIDLLHNDSKNKQNRVIKELVDADIFIFLRSKSVNLSKWASLEREIAYALGKNIIDFDLRDEWEGYKIHKFIEQSFNKNSKKTSKSTAHKVE